MVSQCGNIRKGQMIQTGRGAAVPLLLWNYTFITFPFSLCSLFFIKRMYPISESLHGTLQGCCHHLLGCFSLIATSPGSSQTAPTYNSSRPQGLCYSILRDNEHGSQQEILQTHNCPHWSTISPYLTPCVWERKLQV